MNGFEFLQLGWVAQAATLRESLGRVLPRLDAEWIDTTTVLGLVGADLALDYRLFDKLPRVVSTRLLGIAKHGHPHATHDGPTKLVMGQEVVGWRWWREPRSEGPVAAPAKPGSTRELLERLTVLEARIAALESERVPVVRYADLV